MRKATPAEARKAEERKSERQAEVERLRRAFQEAYDREHPGEARMRRLVNEPIAEPERSRLIALAGAATEFVWKLSLMGNWMRCPVVYKDADVVAVLIGKEPVWAPLYLNADVLSSKGIAISPLVGADCFFSQKAKESEEKIRWTYVNIGGFAFDLRDAKWAIGIDLGGPSTTAVTRTAPCLAALGLTASATEQDVRSAFRRLVKTAHPDQGGTDEAFRTLQQNYQAALALVGRSK